MIYWGLTIAQLGWFWKYRWDQSIRLPVKNGILPIL
jgi:hypothetical protein